MEAPCETERLRPQQSWKEILVFPLRSAENPMCFHEDVQRRDAILRVSFSARPRKACITTARISWPQILSKLGCLEARGHLTENDHVGCHSSFRSRIPRVLRSCVSSHFVSQFT
ncbi:hypothetical protein HYQ46_004086 [Verticillium longisporum]|nr:hypothetical protein HYQ46_004086 [Verticillium longisporum]